MKSIPEKQLALLSIVKYPIWAVPFGFLSMAFFRLPLLLHRKVSFWRLMGCGKNGSFDLVPDFRQWSVLTLVPADKLADLPLENKTQLQQLFYGRFICLWMRLFRTHSTVFLLDPIEGHGLWNGKKVFGNLDKQTAHEGEIAVLTRATIRLSKLKHFWKNVASVANQMAAAPGFITSYGIGEIPFVKQATFSVWQSRELMKQFAYGMQEHKTVIRKTHKEKWYSEEMFVRFKILARFFQEN